jgi:hypothetical protein
MNIKTLWNERFGMLMASGSPGSALAYQLGSTVSEADVVRRKSDAAGPETDGQNAQSTTASSGHGLREWLRQAFDRLDAWSWAREMRAAEAYLAQAQTHADLEQRMRHLHDQLLSRSHALR